MAKPLIAGLPPDLVLSAGYEIRLAALDAATGAAVAGVKLANVSLFVTQISGPSLDDGPTPQLVPSSEVV